MKRPWNFKDLTGLRFGMLEVLEPSKCPASNLLKWRCKCDCGNEHVVVSSSLNNGKATHCGCKTRRLISQRNTRHGGYRTPLHAVWRTMLRRCGPSPTNTKAKYYYERGIRVCEEWKTFEAFRDWAQAQGYREGLTVERIDNDGNYSPGNCRLATNLQQARNKSTSFRVTYKGETLCLSEMCEKHGVRYSRVHNRITSLGWAVEDAFERPARVTR